MTYLALFLSLGGPLFVLAGIDAVLTRKDRS